MSKQDEKGSIDLVAFGMVRIGVASPELRVADVDFNFAEICRVAEQAKKQHCNLVLFPEMGLTGYTCADLFYQQQLQQQVSNALLKLIDFTALMNITIVVGVPIPQSPKHFSLIPVSFTSNVGLVRHHNVAMIFICSVISRFHSVPICCFKLPIALLL